MLYFTVKEHYTGNKVRNAQVREDVPKARVEQELETLRYQSYIQEQLVFIVALSISCPFKVLPRHSIFVREENDAFVAKQIALSMEWEERQRERDLQQQMRLQLRLCDEATQLEIERHIQEEKDKVLIYATKEYFC